MAARPKKPARTTKAKPAKKPPPKKKAAPKKAPPAKKATAEKKAPAAKKRTVAPKKKVVAKKTAPKKTAPKKPAPKKKLGARTTANEAPETKRSVAPPTTPSERVLASCAALPDERPLTAEESEAMMKVAETARVFLAAQGRPDAVVTQIAAFVDEVRAGRREEPKSQDVRLGLGVLWGEQLRAAMRWSWVHLTYADGFASYALVPDDRAFACFPLNRVPDALRSTASNTAAHVFASICQDRLPVRKDKAYLVIG